MKISLPPAPWDPAPVAEIKPEMNRLGGVSQRSTYSSHSAEARELLKTPGLTPRQKAVLELRAQGCTNFEIGQQLGFGEDAATVHVSAARKKARAAQ